MKKWIVLIALGMVATIFFTTFSKRVVKPIPTNTPSPKFEVNLIIDYGNKNINSYEVIADSNSTAYSILKETLEKENIYYEVQQYDFGVFVKKIGDMESDSKKAWIYYINDTSADKASDQYTLNEKDTILWKYETPK